MDAQTFRQKASAWLTEMLDGSGDRLDPQRALLEMVRSLSLRHAAFVVQHAPGVVAEFPLALDTFGEAWRDRHVAERYDLVDPCRHAPTAARSVFDWRDIHRDKPRMRKFLRDFQDLQLGRQALTRLHRGEVGDRSLLTFTSDATDRRWLSLARELEAAMDVIHPQLHRAILRSRFGFLGPAPVRLTARERECIGWAAHGRTSKEIGEKLGLTPATVNFFIESAVLKLEASNRAHAAAKAVSLGLVAPPR